HLVDHELLRLAWAEHHRRDGGLDPGWGGVVDTYWLHWHGERRMRQDAPARAPAAVVGLETDEPLRAVVRDRRARDFLERSVRLRRIAHELRRVRVDLVQVRAVRREPAVARAAADGVVQGAKRAVALDLRARGVARDLEPVAVDLERRHVAVT